MTRTETVVAEGFSYLEGPRWRDGRLFASDFYTHRVLSFGPGGDVEVVATLNTQPSGLGWLPDGSLLVAEMGARQVTRVVDGRQSVYADLTDHATWDLNDLLVDATGRAYVGNFGFDLMHGAVPRLADLVCIDTDRSVRVVAPDLNFPNGMALTDDGHTMIVAESFGQRLTAFDVRDDGTLANKRCWASFGEVPTATQDLDSMLAQVTSAPDGICLDAEGCVWFADGFAQRLVRVREGGQIVEEIATPESVFACMLGGPDGRTLFVCSAPSFAEADASTHHRARLVSYQVDIPHAGRP